MKPLSKINKDFLTDIMKGINYFNSIGCKYERRMYYEDISIVKDMPTKQIINTLKKEIRNQNSVFYTSLALKIIEDLEE